MILCPAEQHVLGGLVDLREVVQEVPDVGADAEIVELSGVDGYPHGALSNGYGSRVHALTIHPRSSIADPQSYLSHPGQSIR